MGIGLGAVIGPVIRMAEPLPAPERLASRRTVAEEQSRLDRARNAVIADLNRRADSAGGAAADILTAQAMIAEDPALAAETESRVAAGETSEWAVHDAYAGFRRVLEAAGGYLGERAADLDDLSQRMIAQLRGVPMPGIADPGHPFVLVARDLAPADTALLNLDRVAALVTIDGGPTSHTAILARAKGIVALVGVAGAASLSTGDTVLVDAARGEVTISPSDEQRAAAAARNAEQRRTAARPTSPGALRGGTPVPLLANLGSASESEEAIALGAEGVGLFRTEFHFLSSAEAPDVSIQREAYREVLKAFPGKKVVVRALDAGADKPLPFLTDAAEENPALGLRGLRVLRAREQVLRDQLQALAEASDESEADLWVMAPMVTTAEEAEYFTRLCDEYRLKTPGVMIEVPASALLAGHILRHTSFASIGTNDLTQYTMAADRLLGSVASYQDPWHPAVLRLVAEAARAAEATGKPVGVCGEAAADPLLAVVLVGLGVSSLSMAPSALADVRGILARYTLVEARTMAAAALEASEARTAREAVLALS